MAMMTFVYLDSDILMLSTRNTTAVLYATLHYNSELTTTAGMSFDIKLGNFIQYQCEVNYAYQKR